MTRVGKSYVPTIFCYHSNDFDTYFVMFELTFSKLKTIGYVCIIGFIVYSNAKRERGNIGYCSIRIIHSVVDLDI